MNLEYEEFASEFLEALQKLIPDATFERVPVEKVNETKDAVRVHLSENKNVIPTVYLDDMYQSYQSGTSPDVLAEKVSDSVYEGTEQFKDAINFNKEKAEERLYPCAINKDMNRHLLSDVPHKDIEGTDLTLIARYRLQDVGYQTASIMVTKDNAPAFGMTPEKALEQAIANGAKANYECSPLTEMLAMQMRKMGAPEEIFKEFQLPKKDLAYVLSNERYIQGAAVLGYPEQIKEALKSIGEEKCYILPSSIHEVLLLPESVAGDKPEQLADMVQSVNLTEVPPGEQLSNHVYFFNGDSLSIADTKELDKKLHKTPGLGKSPSKSYDKSKGPVR